jgi:DNA-binding XRE family transcriptional regulator
MKETLETKRGNYLEGKYLIKNTEWEECSSCGEKLFGPKILKELDRAYYVNNDLIFPEEIKRKRKGCGKTQLELAEAIGVSENSIKRWEKGSYIQPADKNKKMKEVFSQWQENRLSNISSDKWVATLMDKSYAAPPAYAGNTVGNVCKEGDKDINNIIKQIK